MIHSCVGQTHGRQHMARYAMLSHAEKNPEMYNLTVVIYL